jgi:hypothetical protein
MSYILAVLGVAVILAVIGGLVVAWVSAGRPQL